LKQNKPLEERIVLVAQPILVYQCIHKTIQTSNFSQ